MSKPVYFGPKAADKVKIDDPLQKTNDSVNTQTYVRFHRIDFSLFPFSKQRMEQVAQIKANLELALAAEGTRRGFAFST